MHGPLQTPAEKPEPHVQAAIDLLVKEGYVVTPKGTIQFVSVRRMVAAKDVPQFRAVERVKTYVREQLAVSLLRELFQHGFIVFTEKAILTPGGELEVSAGVAAVRPQAPPKAQVN